MIRTALVRSAIAATAAPRASASTVPGLVRCKHSLPELPYSYDSLEPHISSKIMELHHSKHHNTYVTNLNAAEEALSKALSANDVHGTVASQAAIKFNGGGHINHSFFWKALAPTSQGGGQLPDGQLKAAIEKQFGSVDELKKKMNAAAAGIQGSGWAWLGYNKGNKSLAIETTKDQDPLLTHTPLVGIDMWEHAFYLQHGPAKPAYLENIWQVVNWSEAERRFSEAQ